MRVAVCDDDKDFLKSVLAPLIKRAVRQAAVDARVSFFTDGAALLEKFSESGFDLVILDIDMPALNGKELAGKLRLLDSTFFLVFATSYRDEVYNTIPYRINAFVTKDSPPEMITDELARVMRECAEFSPEVYAPEVIVNGEKKLARIPINDLFYFCCVRRKIYLHTSSSEYLLAETRFADIEARFLERGFYEVCRGYIVNTGKISLVGKSGVTLDNGEELPLSRGRCRELRERLLCNITTESDLL